MTDPGRSVFCRAAAAEKLSFLDFRDGLRSGRFADGKRDPVAGVQRGQHAGLYLELLGRAGGRSDSGAFGAAWRRLNGDGPADPIDHGDRSCTRVLRQPHRTDEREQGTRQKRLYQPHRDLPDFEHSGISAEERIWFPGGKPKNAGSRTPRSGHRLTRRLVSACGPIHQHVIASKGGRLGAIMWSIVKHGGNRFSAVDMHRRVENTIRQ